MYFKTRKHLPDKRVLHQLIQLKKECLEKEQRLVKVDADNLKAYYQPIKWDVKAKMNFKTKKHEVDGRLQH